MASVCQICCMKFEHDSILLSHINIHIGRKCKICDKIFHTEASNSINTNNKCIESHIWLSKQSQKKQDIPDIISYDNYQPHSNTIPNHPNINNDWHCKYCEYKTCSRHRLTKHMRTHTNERPYKCDECGRRFTVQCNLKQHIQSIHTKVKPFQCDICSLGFIRRDKLREHQRIHTGEKPYKCEFCEQQFARKSSLNKHIKTHIGFKCRFCENMFESEAQLRSHKKAMHKDVNNETGAKWFKFGCNLCQKRFFTHDLLSQHLSLHKGFACNDCCTIFDTDKELKQHECDKGNKISMSKPLKVLQHKILTDNKKHHCFECDKYFKSGSALGGHRARVHSRKRNKDNKRIDGLIKKKKKKKKKKEDFVETSDDNEGENELDILVRGHTFRKEKEKEKESEVKPIRNKFGVNIFGEYDKNNDVKSNKRKRKEHKSSRNTRSKTNKVEAFKDCPARHGLKKQLTPNNRVFECDECQKTMFLNEEMFGCRYCNFDLCVDCYLGQWRLKLCVDQVLMMNVSVDKTDVETKYKCDEMIWYKETDEERSKWCEYIRENDIKCLDTKFVEYMDMKYVSTDSNKDKDHFKHELKSAVFINPTIFDDDMIALKVLSTGVASNGDMTMKSVIFKMEISSINKKDGNEECKTMRYDYDIEQSKRVYRKKPKIILSLRKKKRNVSNANGCIHEPLRKKPKLTIKIPRLKKTEKYFTVEYHKA